MKVPSIRTRSFNTQAGTRALRWNYDSSQARARTHWHGYSNPAPRKALDVAGLTLVFLSTVAYAGISMNLKQPTGTSLENEGTALRSSVVPVEEIINKLLHSLNESLQVAAREFLRQAGSMRNPDQFRQIESTVDDLVHHASTLHQVINRSLEGRQITMEIFNKELEVVLAKVVEELKKEFPQPDRAPTHAERVAMVSYTLDKVEAGFLNLCAQHGIDKALLSDSFRVIRPHLHALVVTTGDLAEQHPKLLSMLIFSVASLLIPQELVLQPLLEIFGFGPKGPSQDTPAAWMQKQFFGAAVPAGSWFSYLQSVAMGGTQDILLGLLGGASVGAIVGNLAEASKDKGDTKK